MNQTKNTKLSEKDRNELLTSPDLTLQTGTESVYYDPTDSPNEPETFRKVQFSPKEEVYDNESDHSDQSDEDKPVKSSPKIDLTASTLFRGLANLLQSSQPKKIEQDEPVKQVQESKPMETTQVANQNTTQEVCQNQIIDQLLLNLEIISRIKENDKLYDSDQLLEIDTRVGQFFRRWFSGDNRSRTLSKIEDIVTLTIDVTRDLLEDQYEDNQKTFNEKETLIRSFDVNKSEYFQKFSKNMALAIQGLTNLKKTYVGDESIKARIDAVIDKLTMRNRKITEQLQIRTNPLA